MNIHSTAISVSLLLGAIAGCATEPSTPSSTPAPQATTQSIAAPATAAPSAPAKPALTTTEETAKAARSLGLSPKVHDGKLMWCKIDAPSGTKLASYNCVRDDQVWLAVKLAYDATDTVDQMYRKNLTQPIAP